MLLEADRLLGDAEDTLSSSLLMESLCLHVSSGPLDLAGSGDGPGSLPLPPASASCLKGLASWVWPHGSGLLRDASCHGPADAPPPPLFLLLFIWIIIQADFSLFIHSVIFIECLCNSVTRFIWSHDIYCSSGHIYCSSGHMTSLAPLLLTDVLFIEFELSHE